MAFKPSYIYDYIRKLCRQQAEVIQEHENKMFPTLDKENHDTRNIRSLHLAAVKHRNIQVTIMLLLHDLLH
jgi:hypothetical protein